MFVSAGSCGDHPPWSPSDHPPLLLAQDHAHPSAPGPRHHPRQGPQLCPFPGSGPGPGGSWRRSWSYKARSWSRDHAHEETQGEGKQEEAQAQTETEAGCGGAGPVCWQLLCPNSSSIFQHQRASEVQDKAPGHQQQQCCSFRISRIETDFLHQPPGGSQEQQWAADNQCQQQLHKPL